MNILEKIVEEKRQEVSRLQARPVSPDHLRWALKAHGARRPFETDLRYPRRGSIALIAEVKKASPSAGVIREDFDPVALAREYEDAGASCLSVLTDEKFFQGSLEYLRQIRDAVRIPLLRKDFIIHERQILESVEWGADAILLIAAILNDDQIAEFMALAKSVGLGVLLEVHDQQELERALRLQAPIIGVNNRDLKTFKVDIATTETLARRLASASPRQPLLVAESGIHTRADVQRMIACGANAILVGESLMREQDISAKIDDLLAA
ncbi:MAG TPA: indole-3-glycerol phosphate synthase TrpC [Methylomirabilota bacterium]|nr:indole-3-glycerol phosphate synthase TrpC [Methylomirabilota bacterium]